MATSTESDTGDNGGYGKDPIARYFEFDKYATSYRREIIGGITTFLAMSYIMFVNPAILSKAGMPEDALFTATGLAAIAGCLLMGLVARYPVGIAPSMGTNAFFAFSVVKGMGISWQNALVAVLLAGVVFMLISLFKLRKIILDAIPADLKKASAAGIGLFIAFIGFKGSGIIVHSDATLVTLGDLTLPTTGLTIFGILVTVICMLRNVPGSIFFGMVATAVLGVITGVIPEPSAIVSSIPSVGPLFGVGFMQLVDHPLQVLTPHVLIAAFIFLFVEFFDTAGTLVAIATKAGLMKDNKLVRGKKALTADSASIVVGSFFGTNPTTSFIESCTGVASGARTGLTALVVAGLFVLAMFFSPLLSVVTANVTAPALIIVGMLMVSVLDEINWKQFEIAVPAFLMVITMPLTYSIANGVALGLVFYPVTMVVQGRGREVHPIMYALFIVFVLYFAFLT